MDDEAQTPDGDRPHMPFVGMWEMEVVATARNEHHLGKKKVIVCKLPTYTLTRSHSTIGVFSAGLIATGLIDRSCQWCVHFSWDERRNPVLRVPGSTVVGAIAVPAIATPIHFGAIFFRPISHPVGAHLLRARP